MRTTTIIALLAAGAVAISIPHISKRAIYENSKGNLDIEVNDSKANFGNQPPWDVLNKAKEKCAQTACNEPYTINTMILDDHVPQEYIITVDATSSVINNDDEKSNLQHMVDIAYLTAKGATDSYMKPYGEGSTCGGPAFGSPCDPGSRADIWEYWFAQSLSVVWRESNGGPLLAQMNFRISVNKVDGWGGGMCKGLTIAATAIAAAINGYLASAAIVGQISC
ncbi:hypothetical protein F4779DRAFT_595576 [Xylariaceae sp. FL0662B]|nr:hypothetical protein F4779DRAFT_595576 [Xylariaceae sp. FL0662B]